MPNKTGGAEISADLQCCLYTLRRKSHLCIPFLRIVRPQSQFPHSCVCERFIYSITRIGPHISLQQNIGRPIFEICKSLTDYGCRNWETEHYNSVLEITISFLGIHKWEPDIYIGFSPALHLQSTFSKAHQDEGQAPPTERVAGPPSPDGQPPPPPRPDGGQPRAAG